MREGQPARFVVCLALCVAALGCPVSGSSAGGASGARQGPPIAGDAGMKPEPTDSNPNTHAGTGGGGGSGGTHSADAGTHSAAKDAGAADAMSAQDQDASATQAGCGSAMVCDSFEDGAMLDASAWQIVAPSCIGTGKVDVDDEVAHGGTRSVRVTGAGGYCNHVFFSPRLQGALPDPLYGRFFVRLGTALGASHVTFFAIHDTAEDKDLRMGGQSEILMWNRESDDATLPELSPTGIAASVKPATKTWLCVEFELAAKAGELRTWVDGKPIAGLTVEGDPTPDVDSQWKRKADWHPQAGDARFGWESYGSDANTLWFDDIALGEARLGCSP